MRSDLVAFAESILDTLDVIFVIDASICTRVSITISNTFIGNVERTVVTIYT